MTAREPLIEWAHQGGAKDCPSNTLLAMRCALAADGARIGLELDVHRSNDGKLVVIHDRTVDRTTDGHGRVRRHNLGPLRTLDAGWWWSPGKGADHGDVPHPLRDEPLDDDRRLPTLEEVLDLRNSDPNVPMTIEIKGWRAAVPLVKLLQAQPAPAGAPTITVTSFFDPILWLVRWRCPQYKRRRFDLAPGAGYMFLFWLRANVGIPPLSSRYARIQIPVKLGVTFTTPRLVRTAQRVRVRGKVRTAAGETRRMAVDVWTIDEREEMIGLIALGVDGIMTDSPRLLREVVQNTSKPRAGPEHPPRPASVRRALLAWRLRPEELGAGSEGLRVKNT